MSKLKWLLFFVGVWGLHEFLGRSLVVTVKNYESILVNVLGIMLIVFLWVKKEYWLMTGGMVNISDKIRFGYVRDYWKIPMLPLYNNIADWVIFVGLLIFLGKMLWKK